MPSPPHLFDEEPQLSLQRLGAGSFATVYVVSGTRVAYKQAHGVNEGGMLSNEYLALDKIYNMCNDDSFFFIPRALGFYDPSSNRSITHTASPTRSHGRRRHLRPMIQSDSFTSFSSPVYAMDRIFHLPRAFAKNIARKFYPEQHQQQPGPRLCRLYLGKVIGPSRFFNSENFPLDPVRYRQLQQLQELSSRGLSTLEDVAYGMGEMLGRIHWRGGYDARDIEFVFGGDGYDGCSYNVIDFNQMRSWSKTLADVSLLVEAHYQNDPYYPRARPNDILYQQFKEGYLNAYPEYPESQTIAETFLTGIEMEQQRRDNNSAQ